MKNSNWKFEFSIKGWRFGVEDWKFRSWFKKFLFSNLQLLASIFFLLSSNLHSQTLDDYFKIASENNPGLKSKYKLVEAAMQRISQESSLPDPTLSFGYFLSPVETRVGPQKARFSLTQMFPWFGTLKAQDAAATYMAEAKFQEFLAAQNKLYYQVAAAYFPIYELEKLILLETENQRLLVSYKEMALLRFQNGKGSMVDVLRVDMLLNEVNTKLSILNQQRKPLETRFNKILNRNENEFVAVEDSLNIYPITDSYRKDSLHISNPLLEELDLKLKASEAKERVAVKQALPKIGLGLDYLIVSERSGMALEGNGKDAVLPMLSVSLPIFRAKYKASKKEAQLMQDSYLFQKEELTNNLTSSYEMTWFEIQKQAALLAHYDRQLQVSQQSLDILFVAYANSGEDFEELLRMQQQLLKYRQLKLAAIVEYHTALAELDYLTAKSK